MPLNHIYVKYFHSSINKSTIDFFESIPSLFALFPVYFAIFFQMFANLTN